jgi:hypothetical protein
MFYDISTLDESKCLTFSLATCRKMSKNLSMKNLFYFTLTVYMLQIIYFMFIIKQHISYASYTLYAT